MRSGEPGQRLRALDAVQRAAAISNTAELRCEALAALMLPDLRFVRELPVHSDSRYAYLDPAFERIAISTNTEPVEIRAVSDNRLLATLSASTNLHSFLKEWSADGRFLAVARSHPDSRHADWEVWDVAPQRRVLLLRDVSTKAFSFHPHLPQSIASIGDTASVWSLEDGRELLRVPLGAEAAALKFSPQGDRFAVTSPRKDSRGMKLSIRDATNPETGELAFCAFTNDATEVAWHPNGRSLAVADYDGVIHWVDAQTGNSEMLGRHKSPRPRIHLSADGANLFTVDWGQDLIWWDARTRRRLFTANLNSSVLQWHADGRRCAVKTESGVQLYEHVQPVARRELADDLGGRLQFAAISPDGRWLAASSDKSARVWDLSSAGPGAPIANAFNSQFYFTDDGRELFGNRVEGRVAVFRWQLTATTNPAAPPVVRRLALRTPQNLTSLSLFSSNVVMTSSNGTRILPPAELASDPERWTPTIPGINGVSPDGRWLGIRQHFGSILTVYRMPGLELVAALQHPTRFGEFEFSPSGDEVAISSQSNASTTFWSTRTWARTHMLTDCSRLLYTPDGRHLWLARKGRKSGLYDARTLEPLLLLPVEVRPLALSPDAKRVVMSVDMEGLQVWELSEVRQQLHAFGLNWVD